MNGQENILQQLLRRDYAIVVRKTADGYSACVPSLGIMVSAATVDACHAMIEERKSGIFRAAVDSGFGDAFLVGLSQTRLRPNILRMFFVLLVLSLLLLTVLIPTTYVVAKIERLVPVFAETAMDVVQRRIKTMSDEEQRKLSGIAGRACPVIDELIAARCRSLSSPASEPAKVLRR